MNRELAKKYFFTHNLGHVLENFKKSKNNFKRNKIQFNIINSGLNALKKEIKNMSKEENKNRKTNGHSKYC